MDFKMCASLTEYLIQTNVYVRVLAWPIAAWEWVKPQKSKQKLLIYTHTKTYTQ